MRFFGKRKRGLSALLEDVEGAIDGGTCRYFNRCSGGECGAPCPAFDSGRACSTHMLWDIASRLRALGVESGKAVGEGEEVVNE